MQARGFTIRLLTASVFTSLPGVTQPGEVRDSRCEVLPGGRRSFSQCCHVDPGCRELPGLRSCPSQRQRLVNAARPPPGPVHPGGPEGSAGLHHSSAPSFSLGQCWSRELSHCTCARVLSSGSVTGNQAENHGEANGGQRRVSRSRPLCLQTPEGFGGRAHMIERDIFLLP